MFVIASTNELNDVVQYINPKYPRQILESIKIGEVFYVINEVPITIKIIPNGYEASAAKNYLNL